MRTVTHCGLLPSDEWRTTLFNRFVGNGTEDSVVERVLHRVGETRAMNRLAEDVATQLRDVELDPRARADWCCL